MKKEKYPQLCCSPKKCHSAYIFWTDNSISSAISLFCCSIACTYISMNLIQMSYITYNSCNIKLHTYFSIIYIFKTSWYNNSWCISAIIISSYICNFLHCLETYGSSTAMPNVLKDSACSDNVFHLLCGYGLLQVLVLKAII